MRLPDPVRLTGHAVTRPAAGSRCLKIWHFELCEPATVLIGALTKSSYRYAVFHIGANIVLFHPKVLTKAHYPAGCLA